MMIVVAERKFREYKRQTNERARVLVDVRFHLDVRPAETETHKTGAFTFKSVLQHRFFVLCVSSLSW
jgi:hypothetical protein